VYSISPWPRSLRKRLLDKWFMALPFRLWIALTPRPSATHVPYRSRSTRHSPNRALIRQQVLYDEFSYTGEIVITYLT
jgi:hypothetical protein